MSAVQINRLREEGSKLLKEQQELLRDQLKKEVECDKDSKIYQDVTPKLKVNDVGITTHNL